MSVYDGSITQSCVSFSCEHVCVNVSIFVDASISITITAVVSISVSAELNVCLCQLVEVVGNSFIYLCIHLFS